MGDSHYEDPKPGDVQDDDKSEHDQNHDALKDEDKDVTDQSGNHNVTNDADRPKQDAAVIYFDKPMYFWQGERIMFII